MSASQVQDALSSPMRSKRWKHNVSQMPQLSKSRHQRSICDKSAGDEPFVESLSFIERAATDDRNFVKKGVSWALRSVGRRNRALKAAAVKLSRRLIDSEEPSARWIGKDTLREPTR